MFSSVFDFVDGEFSADGVRNLARPNGLDRDRRGGHDERGAQRQNRQVWREGSRGLQLVGGSNPATDRRRHAG